MTLATTFAGNNHNPRSPLRVYIAGAKSVAPRARTVSMLLRCQGYDVVSRWHHSMRDARVDPCMESARVAILGADLADLELAQVVVAITDSGKPRATLVEIGYAIALGTRVIWQIGVDGTGRNLFDSHECVTRVTSTVGVFSELKKLWYAR